MNFVENFQREKAQEEAKAMARILGDQKSSRAETAHTFHLLGWENVSSGTLEPCGLSPSTPHRREYSSMVNKRGIVRLSHGRGAFLRRAAVVLAAAIAVPATAQIPSAPVPIPAAPAQNGAAPESQASPSVKERFLIDRFPDKPSVPPSFTIPIEPLGFTAPGPIYLGARNTMASLDFLDENRLLLTFRVPGLLHRDLPNGEEGDERQIRAIVLALPQGTVEAAAMWTVHDRVRYLWPLKNGHFLFRDRNNLFEGDATLTLKPYLEFPGALLWLELDPEQHFLVTNSREPVTKPANPGAPADRSSSAGWNPGASADRSSSAAWKPEKSPARRPLQPPSLPDWTPLTLKATFPILWSAFFAVTPVRSCWSAVFGPPFICPSTPWATSRTCAAAEQSGC